MKLKLSQDLVLKLNIDQKPKEILHGKIIFEQNISRSEYYVYDDHREAPTGFSVKVSKTKKSYVIQRRVTSSKVIKSKVGNVSDFNNIESARIKAREMIQVATKTKKNPNSIIREKNSRDITLNQAFEEYKNYLNSKPQQAKKNTFKVINQAIKRLSYLINKSISEIKHETILTIFDDIAINQNHRTAAEQTFRWANSATNYALKIEKHNAASENRAPTISYNPFSILATNQKFRTRPQLEASYKAKGVRNQLTNDSLGKWLEQIYLRRMKNRIGCDFLLLTTLLGTRKTECLQLKWRHLIRDEEAINSSWVDLENRQIHFFDTKNRSDLDLPICDGAFELFSQRKDLIDDVILKNQIWVFPAISKHSKVGHYTSMEQLITNICEGANIKKIGMHDLRRTFARTAEELSTYAVTKYLINHKTLSDPTSAYIEVDINRVKDAMQRIEFHILQSCPNFYNLLLTPKYSPLPIKNEK